MSHAEQSKFTVIHFALETDGTSPRQRSATCGNFLSVEDAFHNARTLAAQTYARLRQNHGVAVANLLDTEWGYDIRLGPLTVHRFWVHEHLRSQHLLT